VRRRGSTTVAARTSRITQRTLVQIRPRKYLFDGNDVDADVVGVGTTSSSSCSTREPLPLDDRKIANFAGEQANLYMYVGNDSINGNDPSGTDALCSLVKDVAEDVLRVVDKVPDGYRRTRWPDPIQHGWQHGCNRGSGSNEGRGCCGLIPLCGLPVFRTGSLGTAVEYLLHPDNALEFAAGINELSQGASGPSMRQNRLQEIEQTFQ
jgi:hypothetical protein